MSPWSLFMRYVTRAGYLPQNIPLEMIRYLSEEKDFLPWHAASRALYPLDKLLDRMENYNVFNEYILKQVATTYLKLGWPKNNFNGSLVQASYQHEELRREVIMLVCSFGNKHCHQQASTLISDWISSNRNRENNGGMEQYQTEFDKVLVFAAANVVRVRYNPSPSESAINTKGQRQGGDLNYSSRDSWCLAVDSSSRIGSRLPKICRATSIVFAPLQDSQLLPGCSDLCNTCNDTKCWKITGQSVECLMDPVEVESGMALHMTPPRSRLSLPSM
ncbi:uncharacterized protein LOC142436717 isoform X2 [Tenrec ecaudatus]|uniref:uncharacterized protein LOC142436717 isoform X2 n=1 Tax=Tenrec ecaudatus TaxID=94439 RepID=UPI003F594216